MARLFPSNNFVAPFLVDGDRLCIAEAPGQTEAEMGEPLVGTSGGWLFGKEDDKGRRSGGLYRAAGVDTSRVSKCNTIQCQPPKNVYPTDPEARSYISKEDAEASLAQCLNNHVKPLLTSRNWNRIDLLGDKALRSLTDRTGGILRWRGSPTAIPACRPEPIAVPTLHPAFIARNQELLPAVIADLKKTLNVPEEHYNTTPELEQVRAFDATEFAFDIETVWGSNRITMVGLCAEATQAICVPFAGVYIDELRRIFSQARTVVGHNCLQFDLPRLQNVGVSIDAACYVFDTMLAQHLLQPDLPHDLGFLGSFFTNKPAWKHLNGDDEALYCCRDVDVTWQCFRQLRPMLRAEKLLDLYNNVQVPLARICHLLHDTGFRIDPARLKTVRADLERKSKELELELPAELQTQEVPIRKRVLAPPGTLSEKTGKPLKYVMTDSTETVTPWKSSDVLKAYFYEQSKLPVQTHAKTNAPSTDKTAIPKLIRAASRAQYAKEFGDEHAGVVLRALRALQHLRQIASLLSTFLQDKWEDSKIERIHANLNVHGTASGRLSSSEPNLQNLPESARCIYVPSYSGWRIFDVDFSSLENRLTAHLSQDHERLERLAQPGWNEHKWTTSQFFDIPYDDVVKDNSKDAPYGMSKRIGHGCLTGEHEVLTKNGWLLIKDWAKYNLCPEIAEWDNGQVSFKTPKAFTVQPFEGQLLTFSGRGFAARTTPDHAFPARKGTTRFHRTAAADLDKQHRVPVTGVYDFPNRFPECDVRLATAIQADSYMEGSQARFHLVRPRKIERLRQLLSGYDFTETPCGCHEGGARFVVRNHNAQIILGTQKLFNSNVLALSREQVDILLEEVLLWDGHVRKTHGVRREFLTTDLQSAVWLQILAHLTGKQALLRRVKKTRGHFGNKPVYCLSFNRRKEARVGCLARSKSNYKGLVYCFTTESGNFLVRYRDRVFVSGNSNYGMGPMKISRLFDLPFADVKVLCDKWKQVNKKTVDWQLETAAKAKSDGFLTTPFGRKRWFYCLAPQTRVLTSDLKWRQVAELGVGNSLIGFDETLSFPGPKFREAVVTATNITNAPRMELCTDKGTVVSTPNHGWVVRLVVGVGGVKRYIHRWLPTEYLKPGDQIVYFNRPWKTETSYDAGWLSGILDGEGTISGKQGRGDVRVTQNLGPVLDRILDTLSHFEIAHSDPRPSGNYTAKEVRCVQDEPHKALEIIGRFQPTRLLKDSRVLWDGKPAWGNTTRHEVATVQYVEKIDDGPVVELSTSTGTLIAEGMLSHNTDSSFTESLSFLPQSCGADIVLRCMIALMYDRIGWPESQVQKLVSFYRALPHPARLLLTVHDSFVGEYPIELEAEVKDTITRVCTQPWAELGGFAIPVEWKDGPSWGECK